MNELESARRAHVRLVRARVARDDAIRAAVAAGHSQREVARASGVNLMQVNTVVRRDGRQVRGQSTKEG